MLPTHPMFYFAITKKNVRDGGGGGGECKGS